MNTCRRLALVVFAALLVLTTCMMAEASEVDDLLRTRDCSQSEERKSVEPAYIHRRTCARPAHSSAQALAQ